MKAMRWLILALLLIMLVGCKGNSQPDDYARDVWKNMAQWEAYSFESTFDVQLDKVRLDKPGMEPLLQLFLQTVQAVSIKIEGRHQAEPLRNEFQLAVEVPQLGIKLGFPLLAADHKLLFQLPEIPFYPLDAELKEKWIEVSPEQLPEMLQPYGQYLLLSKKDRERLSTAMLELLLDQLGDKEYLQWVELSEAGLPDDLATHRVLMWQMDEDKKADVLKKVKNKLLPEWEALLLQPRWLEALSLDEEGGKHWGKQAEEWSDQLQALQHLTILLAVDEQQRPLYRRVSMQLQGEGDQASGGVQLQMNTRWYAQDVATIPDGNWPQIGESISLDQWLEQIP